jgi:hypothetical protein
MPILRFPVWPLRHFPTITTDSSSSLSLCSYEKSEKSTPRGNSNEARFKQDGRENRHRYTRVTADVGLDEIAASVRSRDSVPGLALRSPDSLAANDTRAGLFHHQMAAHHLLGRASYCVFPLGRGWIATDGVLQPCWSSGQGFCLGWSETRVAVDSTEWTGGLFGPDAGCAVGSHCCQTPREGRGPLGRCQTFSRFGKCLAPQFWDISLDGCGNQSQIGTLNRSVAGESVGNHSE